MQVETVFVVDAFDLVYYSDVAYSALPDGRVPRWSERSLIALWALGCTELKQFLRTTTDDRLAAAGLPRTLSADQVGILLAHFGRGLALLRDGRATLLVGSRLVFPSVLDPLEVVSFKFEALLGLLVAPGALDAVNPSQCL